MKICRTALKVFLLGVAVHAGSAMAETTRRTLTLAPYSSVRLELSADLTITIGAKSYATVEADAKVLELIVFDVSDEQLTIRPASSFSTQQPIRIALESPRLTAVELNASGQIELRRLDQASLSLAINGAGDIAAEGQVTKLVAVVSGAGDLKLRRLQAAAADVAIDGAGNIETTAESQLTASIHGSGDIVFYGEPDAVTAQVSGAGEIRHGRLPD